MTEGATRRRPDGWTSAGKGPEFLGFALRGRQGRSGRPYPHVEPQPKSRLKLREGIREILNRGTLWRSTEEGVTRRNRRRKGWTGYFHDANSTRVLGKVGYDTRTTLRRWLGRQHGCARALWASHTDADLHERFGWYRRPAGAAWKAYQ